MDEQTEMELGMEAQYREHEDQREQLLAEIQEHNRQLQAENKKLREATQKIIEIKQWCNELNVKYNNYETALNERIDYLEQILKTHD